MMNLFAPYIRCGETLQVQQLDAEREQLAQKIQLLKAPRDDGFAVGILS